MNILKSDDYVYCTNCKHFRTNLLSNDEADIIPHCKYVDKCNIWNFEDGIPYSERPMYEK